MVRLDRRHPCPSIIIAACSRLRHRNRTMATMRNPSPKRRSQDRPGPARTPLSALMSVFWGVMLLYGQPMKAPQRACSSPAQHMQPEPRWARNTPMGAISPRHAGLSRRRCLFRRSHPREKPGSSTWQREIPRDTDCPLERDGFEPSVPRRAFAFPGGPNQPR
jgi:hypothetical protein